MRPIVRVFNDDRPPNWPMSEVSARLIPNYHSRACQVRLFRFYLLVRAGYGCYFSFGLWNRKAVDVWLNR